MVPYQFFPGRINIHMDVRPASGAAPSPLRRDFSSKTHETGLDRIAVLGHCPIRINVYRGIMEQ